MITTVFTNMQSGLLKTKPDRRDYSLVHSFGATLADLQSLPADFSIYDGRAIPNQEVADYRFTPPVQPLWYGCTSETATFDAGLQDGKVYRPDLPYLNTAPYRTDTGRDMRLALQTLIDKKVLETQGGEFGPQRLAYFNCYGAGKIDDFDAARIGIWINQFEKRGVWVGSWWYAEFATPGVNGILPIPSFNTNQATLHCWLITGWKEFGGEPYLEGVSWQGNAYGDTGKHYMSRTLFNALMAQPYTSAFTITKQQPSQTIPVGLQAQVDHIVYLLTNFIKQLWDF